jgi:hypothetical protein
MVATGVVDSFARLPALLLGNLVGLVMLVREGWSTGGRMRGIRRWRGAMVPIVFLYMIIAWLAWILYPLCAFLLRVLHRRRPLSTFERAALDGVPAEVLTSSEPVSGLKLLVEDLELYYCG